jgi:hypothetical protein
LVIDDGEMAGTWHTTRRTANYLKCRKNHILRLKKTCHNT